MELKSKYTRKIDRGYKELLMGDAEISIDEHGNASPKIVMSNLEKANDFLVKEMYSLSEEELDNLDSNMYDECLKKVTDLKKEKDDKKKG